METQKIVSERTFNAADFAQKKASELLLKFKPKEEVVEAASDLGEQKIEEVVEPQIKEETEGEEVIESEKEEEEVEAEEALTPKEAALMKEIVRLKAERREENQEVRIETQLGEVIPTVEEKETTDISPAEARLFTAWRDEALEELIEENPQLGTSPKLWEQFKQEYDERVPELAFAQKKKIPVTKKFFKERLNRVYRSVVPDPQSSKEEGKKELLKTQSAAAIMAASAKKGQGEGGTELQPKRKVILLKRDHSLMDWLPKKT